MKQPLPPSDDEALREQPAAYGENLDRNGVEYRIVEGEDFSDDAQEPDPEAPQVIRKTYSELREIQRLLMDDIRSGSVKPSEKASCAKAYRDIEILRRAIRGKPVLIAQSVRVDSKPTTKAEPIVLDIASERAA